MLSVLGEEGYGDPMHCAVLADFSRCLHVRKRTYFPPNDLGNRAHQSIPARNSRENSGHETSRLFDTDERRTKKNPEGTRPRVGNIVRQSGVLEKTQKPANRRT